MERDQNKEKMPILDQQEVKDFIKNRDIQPKDFHLIEELSSFSKNMIIVELHNLFNIHHERSGKELERMIENTDDTSKQKLFETMNLFYQKYDWITSWNLVRLLERI